MKDIRILVLDDEKVFRKEIKEFLDGEGFTALTAERPSEAFEILQENQIDIMILDLRLPEMDGLQVLEKVKNEYPDIEVIMITGHGDMDAVINAMRLGAVEFFPKPFRLLDMRAAIQRTKRYISLHEQLKEISQTYSLVSKDLIESIGSEIIGNSFGIRQVVDLMGKVAKTDNTSVLITGESGTGKELVARGIHYLSSRKKSYFYAVNCSAIPDSLFESEFFGHKKGAFTGANEDKAGWFEVAHGGTLFLDEVVEMQPAMQSKLLRVLEERKIRRIGSSVDIPIDVRIIAATNQDVNKLIEEGKFRSDLYYRLNSFQIHIPPLRERKEDIPLLLDYYLKHISKKLGKKITSVDPMIEKAMLNYSFPGNVREMRNMIERAIILSDSGRLTMKNFVGLIAPQVESNASGVIGEDIFDLELIEKIVIMKALEKTGYKKSEAAQLLNITRQALDRRIEKYDINL
ncbi:sigma-54-dependent transcriptional regulator [Tenuifilum thalassicum]|uniref:Sigma-54-dependent Fis family transcriptional regulator n=1 Tax=Tenuifilum thalassicum TaxID=2590900 RepID=A0A7D3XK92_9BACT|nr:sigma-54 dependent transcriptional regulator [Tenuifilum thalassicum]QKG79630.1 sigma-54-dependent Fis family transcriptional regulator [Tenuifilum thalassicum]